MAFISYIWIMHMRGFGQDREQYLGSRVVASKTSPRVNHNIPAGCSSLRSLTLLSYVVYGLPKLRLDVADRCTWSQSFNTSLQKAGRPEDRNVYSFHNVHVLPVLPPYASRHCPRIRTCSSTLRSMLERNCPPTDAYPVSGRDLQPEMFGFQDPCAEGKHDFRKDSGGFPQLLWQRCEVNARASRVRAGSCKVSPKSQVSLCRAAIA
ncbi:hypothetical protein K466DRAFT_328612 [Polyporus arcularius HHB13444]|uniref:Uncharacterized protein n=1 Tax=Polyporus arcularius HHB13444 TaxID=1314778 RepID=A0A5C3NXB3_9APHY|nr:hypothetical protein K466DRAFT_328612 [Polyporus arcularius HHB13444]